MMMVHPGLSLLAAVMVPPAPIFILLLLAVFIWIRSELCFPDTVIKQLTAEGLLYVGFARRRDVTLSKFLMCEK
jgi:hypothetical protein